MAESKAAKRTTQDCPAGSMTREGEVIYMSKHFRTKILKYRFLRNVKKAVDPLCHALHDKNSSVRRTAIKALGQLGDARAVDPLCRALQDK